MSRRAGMFGSEAGLVRIAQKPILVTTATTADSGPQCLEGKNWRNWTFTVESTGTGWSVTFFGTNDPLTAGSLPGTPTAPAQPNYQAITPTQANWFQIPGESVQSGTGTEINPITAITQSLSYDRPLLAVRAVVVGNTLGNKVTVRVAAVP